MLQVDSVLTESKSQRCYTFSGSYYEPHIVLDMLVKFIFSNIYCASQRAR